MTARMLRSLALALLVLGPACHAPAPPAPRAAAATHGLAFAWARTLSADDCIAVDALIAAEDLVLLGSMHSRARLDGHDLRSDGAQDTLVAGLDPKAGNVRWARLHGEEEDDVPHLLTRTGDHEMLVGVSAGRRPEMNVAGTSTLEWISLHDGSKLRSEPVDDSLDNARWLQGGDLLVVARPNVAGDPFDLIRKDLRGRARWTLRFEATETLHIRYVVTDDRDAFVIGSLVGEPRFGEGLWVGSRRPRSWDDYFAARIDLADGRLRQASWLFSATRYERIGGVEVDGDRLLLAVDTLGTTSFLDRTLESTGPSLWVISAPKTLAGVTWAERLPIDEPRWRIRARRAGDRLVVAGLGPGSIRAGAHRFGAPGSRGTVVIAELGRDGRVLSAQGFDSDTRRELPALTLGAGGEIYIAGPLSVPAVIGPAALTPVGGGRCDTIYVAKLVLPPRDGTAVPIVSRRYP